MVARGLPEGTLTFLLTDMVGSTKAWESDPNLMRDVMSEHDRIVSQIVGRHDGVLVESGREGDSVLAVFRRAADAATCALALQRAFATGAWPPGEQVQIRIALHTGEAELREGHYHGPPLNRCARLLATCHGGQVLTTQATQQLLVDQLPAQATLWDLGNHRLKDLLRSEHVFQLVDVERPAEFPRIRSLPSELTNLPVQLTEFVGREEALRSLNELRRQARLLTLIGPGGVGKTRLALQLAAELTGDYRDGVWLVELGPVSDPGLVPQAVAHGLDLEEQAGRPLLDTLVERCRERRLLLVLDNCEHLVEASAELVERLLTNCREVSIVATSREPLKLSGEQVWPVPALTRAEAVRLFAERAARHAPGFRVSVGSSLLVAEICERLDDLPLAIELAAARLPLLPLEEIAKRLESRFALLTGGSRTASARQRTLQGVVEWSHELLTEDEKLVFRRLAVFAGRFALGDSEAVCADETLPAGAVLELVSRLSDKSLLMTTDGQCRMLVTIREYGLQRLGEAGEADALRRRLGFHLLGLAQARQAGELASWLDRLESLHEDVQAVIRWSVDNDPELGMRLADAMSTFWQLRRHTAEPRQLVEALLENGDVDSPLWPRLEELAGAFAYLQGDFDAARDRLEAALRAGRARADAALVVRVLNRTGLLAVARGDRGAARATLEEALALARELGDQQEEANSLHQLGLLVGTRGDLASAASMLEQSIDLRIKLGRRDETSVSLTFLAFNLLHSGERERAREYIKESLEIGRALNDRRTAWSLDVLACLSALDGQPEQALRLAGAGAAMHDSIGNRPSANWQALTAPMLDSARAALGQEAADAAWRAGRTLNFDEAMTLALAAVGAGTPSG